MLHDVKAAYDSVVKYGQEKWSLAAIRRTTYAERLAYQKLYAACERAPPPLELATLGEDAARQYRAVLCNQFRKQAPPTSP